MHRNTRRVALTGAAALAAAGLLSACATDTGTAGSSGITDPVTFGCNTQDDWCQVMSDAFTADTGIPARFVRINTGETLARLQAASSSPEFDVWVGGNADSHIAAWDAGLLEAYDSPSAEAIAPEHRDPDGHWTGLYLGALSFCSNGSVLDDLGVDAPESWDDLLDPALKGQVALAHPSTSGTSYTALWTQVELNGGDQDAALEYFARLNSNILQYPKTGGAPGQMAGRGEIAVGVVFAHDCQQYINEGFSDLEITFPAEGTGFEIGAISKVKGSPNQEGADVFIDWALSPEAQALGETASAFQIPSNPETPVSDNMVDLDSVTLVPYDALAAAQARTELTARFDNDIAAAPRD